MIALDELSTYSLVDFIPVEKEVYFRLFERQHEMLWPFQVIAVCLMFFIAFRIYREKYRFIFASLAFALTVVALTFHLKLVSELSWVGDYFAGLFILQACAMVVMELIYWRKWESVLSQINPVQFNFGLSLSIFAAVLYPLVIYWCHQSVVGTELFAVTPDATMLFVLGVLYSLPGKHKLLCVLPLLWCLISGAIWYSLEWFPGLVTWVLVGLSLLLSCFILISSKVKQG